MSQSVDILKELLRQSPPRKDQKPNEFVQKYWAMYKDLKIKENSINGAVFEQIIILCFIKAGIQPVYHQTKLAFVPNVIIDMVLYHPKTPYIISAKTTLRERWKQADLEAMATKNVHRQARCFLVTLFDKEVASRRKDENSCMGLDGFVLANTTEFNDLIDEMKSIKFTESAMVDIIQNKNDYSNNQKIKETYKIEI